MARLDEFLARWLLKRAKRDAAATVSEALIADSEAKSQRLERQHQTAVKRAAIHEKLKLRHRQLKREFKAMKELARQHRHEAWKWETECRVQKESLDSFWHRIYLSLSCPGVHAPLEADHNQWRTFVNQGGRVWKHEMRLGVLRQYEPRPMMVERFPAHATQGMGDSLPLVSIVTPSFQQAAFIERTMRSVLDQDYPRLEYRIMDGGSTDGSVGLIERCSHPKFMGWRSERDSGPASAINKGFAQSGGDIMGWLNSDDVLMPGTVRYVADYFASHPEIDVVYGHRVIIDERDWEVGRWVLPRHEGAMQLWADYVPQETLFWRRSLWDRIGGSLDESYKFAFDWDLILRFQKVGARFVRLPRFMGCFRVHDAQKSSAEISSVGMAEMARLRERELGGLFTEHRLARRVVLFQRNAVRCARLLRRGIRW